MRCKTCGNQLTGTEAFCGVCGAPVGTRGTTGARDAGRRMTVRLLCGVGACALGAVALLFAARFFASLDQLVNEFSSLEVVVAGVGTAAHVLCVSVLVLCASMACWRLCRVGRSAHAKDARLLALPLVLCVLLFVLCSGLYVCGFVVPLTTGGEVTDVARFVVGAYSQSAAVCLLLTVVAFAVTVLAMRLVVRTRG